MIQLPLFPLPHFLALANYTTARIEAGKVITSVGTHAYPLDAATAAKQFIDGQPIVRTEVLPKLQAMHKEFPDKRLYLKGDDRRPYGEMRDLFRDRQKVGFAGVRLLVGTSAAATQAKKE